MSWLNQLLSHGGPQTKKVTYLSTVFVGLFCLVADLFIEKVMSAAWVSAFSVLTGFVTTGYVITKKIAKDGQ